MMPELLGFGSAYGVAPSGEPAVGPAEEYGGG